jgi:hypothetical protein
LLTVFHLKRCRQSDSNLPLGIGLGAAPFVLAPFAALAAGRPLAMKAAAARQATQDRKAAEDAKAASKLSEFTLDAQDKSSFGAVLALGAASVGGLLLQVVTGASPGDLFSKAPSAPAIPGAGNKPAVVREAAKAPPPAPKVPKRERVKVKGQT